MENSNASNLLAVGLLAGIGYLVYRTHQRNQAILVAATPGPTLSETGLPPSTGFPGGAAVPSQTFPVATILPGVPNGIDPTVYARVQQFVMEDGRAPVIRFGAAAIPSEYAGLYDIAVNFWDKNIKVPSGSPQEKFWNQLRAKYDPGPPPDQIW